MNTMSKARRQDAAVLLTEMLDPDPGRPPGAAGRGGALAHWLRGLAIRAGA